MQRSDQSPRQADEVERPITHRPASQQQAKPSPDRHGDERLHGGLLAASRFLGRFSQLDLPALGSAIRMWHHSADDAWFEAEAAVARGIERGGLYREQEMLLEQAGEFFRRTDWFRQFDPGTAVAASEASAQYIGTLATLAVLVRDQITFHQFHTLYRPFARLIPLPELER